MNLQDFFHSNIPIIESNDFDIRLNENRDVTVSGSIGKHFNHKQTVYGGSITNALIIAAFGYLHVLLEDRGYSGASVFLKKNTTEFKKPLIEDFIACSVALSTEDIANLMKELSETKKAAITVIAYAAHKDDAFRYAQFDGVFSIKIQ